MLKRIYETFKLYKVPIKTFLGDKYYLKYQGIYTFFFGGGHFNLPTNNQTNIVKHKKKGSKQGDPMHTLL